SLVEAKTKSKKALYMSDLSSTEETVSANKRYKETIISSPTLSTNSCPLFSDSDNDQSSKKSSTKPKFSTTMTGSDNENFSGCSPLPKILNDYPHEVVIDDSENKLKYKEPNYSPPVTCESLKTIEYKNKKQNGWSPLKLDSPDKNVKGNSELIFKRKPSTYTPTANLNTFSSKQQIGSPYSKTNENENSVVRELFSNSNKPEDDESSFSYTNCFGKKKSYHVEQDDGPNRGVIAEVTPQRFSNVKYDIWNLGMQKYVLKKIENAADNNYINSETLTESLFNDLTDCPLPIDNITISIHSIRSLETNVSVNELSCTGGKNLKLMVKRIMNKLFTDELMSQYSFTGKKGKSKFNNLFILFKKVTNYARMHQ
ncbi:DUF4806 domain-containing protein, partial [Aphis craccivora]